MDADHSLLGATEDVTLAVALSALGAAILCHDVDPELFPGVVAATEALTRAGVLKLEEKILSLALFRVVGRPSWLLDPGVYRDKELP